MKQFAATIKQWVRSAGRWYVDSCSHLDPAAALGMFGTGMVAIPVSLATGPAEGR